MGTWNTGSFDNDDALDWLYELEEAVDLEILEDAFETIFDQQDGMPDGPDCMIALAAAEVVACLLGNPDENVPDEVVSWVKNRPEPEDDLIKQARGAIRIILRNSELKQLWSETDDYAEWMAVSEALLARLTS